MNDHRIVGTTGDRLGPDIGRRTSCTEEGLGQGVDRKSRVWEKVARGRRREQWRGPSTGRHSAERRPGAETRGANPDRQRENIAAAPYPISSA